MDAQDFSDSKSHDSNRNPKFRSIRCGCLYFLFFKCLGFFIEKSHDSRCARFGSLADPDSSRAHRDMQGAI